MRNGEDPPLDATYGEFPLPLFTKLVDRACEIAGVGDDRSATVIADLGSGTGRLDHEELESNIWTKDLLDADAILSNIARCTPCLRSLHAPRRCHCPLCCPRTQRLFSR